MLSNKVVLILNHVTSMKRGDVESIDVCILQVNGKELPLRVVPRRVQDVPYILYNSEQPCVQKFDRSIAIWIEI